MQTKSEININNVSIYCVQIIYCSFLKTSLFNFHHNENDSVRENISRTIFSLCIVSNQDAILSNYAKSTKKAILHLQCFESHFHHQTILLNVMHVCIYI